MEVEMGNIQFPNSNHNWETCTHLINGYFYASIIFIFTCMGFQKPIND